MTACLLLPPPMPAERSASCLTSRPAHSCPPTQVIGVGSGAPASSGGWRRAATGPSSPSLTAAESRSGPSARVRKPQPQSRTPPASVSTPRWGGQRSPSGQSGGGRPGSGTDPHAAPRLTSHRQRHPTRPWRPSGRPTHRRGRSGMVNELAARVAPAMIADVELDPAAKQIGAVIHVGMMPHSDHPIVPVRAGRPASVQAAGLSCIAPGGISTCRSYVWRPRGVTEVGLTPHPTSRLRLSFSPPVDLIEAATERLGRAWSTAGH